MALSKNPQLRVHTSTKGKISVEEMTLEEQQAHAQMLWQSLEDLDGTDDSFLHDIQKEGGTIYGLDKQGTIQEAGPL